MSRGALISRYVAFAVIATAVNLAAQRAVLTLSDHLLIFFAAMTVGTAAGLVVKYVLDQRWIFNLPQTELADHARKFSLYSLTGVVTTLLFWGTETAFWLTWQTQTMREVGALIGLGIGYLAKYHLDSRFVFPAVQFARPAQ